MKVEFVSEVSNSSGVSLPYKIFTCQLNDNGTNVPAQIVLENTLGITLTITNLSAGGYGFTLSQAIDLSKSTFFLGNMWFNNAACYWGTIVVLNTTSFTLLTQENNVPIRQDNLFGKTLLEIKEFI